MLKQTTALATLAAVLTFGQAHAENMSNANTDIKNLPKSGSVSLTGTVDSIDDNKSFTLSDGSGDTIDIESVTELSLNEGDRVQISGEVDSEFLGISKEIDATSVRVIDAANERTDNTASNSATGSYDTRANTNMTTGVAASADRMANDVERSADRMAKSVSDSAENAQNRVNKAIEGGDNTEWHGGEYGAIDKLPESGSVSITGNVASVTSDKMSFTLEDETGETIDVHSKSRLDISAGDSVTVQGTMEDEVAGMGEQIVDAGVMLAKK